MASKDKDQVVGEHESTWGATEATKARFEETKAEAVRRQVERRNKEADGA